MFNTALSRVLRDNLDFMPPHRRGAMYLRPVMFGCGARMGLGPAPEYKFIVFAAPVGDYYAGVMMRGLCVWGATVLTQCTCRRRRQAA
jgi:branched-chain amino acid aminotransferase